VSSNQGNLEALQEKFETTETKMEGKAARKRKSDDIADVDLDELYVSPPDFARYERVAKPTIPNTRDAFFEKNITFGSSSGGSLVESSVGTERVIKTAKSFIDDDDPVPYPASNIFSPLVSPMNCRHESKAKPLNSGFVAGTPCGVVDELFTGIYSCMPSWECSLPWTENDDDESVDDKNYRYGIVDRATARDDAKGMRDHLSFPKQLGREHALQSEDIHVELKSTTTHHGIHRLSRPKIEDRRKTRKNTISVRSIHRSPSSRSTTLESDSRHKLSGSKIIRRTEINRVTEIHWDEELLDTKTLEQMAKLSVQ